MIAEQCLRPGRTQIRLLAGKEENGSHNGFGPAHPAGPVGLFAYSPGGDGLRMGTGDFWQVQEASTKTKILRGPWLCEDEEDQIKERRRKEKGR